MGLASRRAVRSIFLPLPLWGSFLLEIAHALRYFPEPPDYLGIVLPAMREETVCAVLDPLFRVAKVAAAGASQGIERTVAEQAVEIVRIPGLVTGEVFALSVAVEGIVGMLPRGPVHALSPGCGLRGKKVFAPFSKNPFC